MVPGYGRARRCGRCGLVTIGPGHAARRAARLRGHRRAPAAGQQDACTRPRLRRQLPARRGRGGPRAAVPTRRSTIAPAIGSLPCRGRVPARRTVRPGAVAPSQFAGVPGTQFDVALASVREVPGGPVSGCQAPARKRQRAAPGPAGRRRLRPRPYCRYSHWPPPGCRARLRRRKARADPATVRSPAPRRTRGR